MDDSSASMIDTRIVYGFKGAGKTSYISDCILNDFFYKRGKTLILCFEQGKEEYDREVLLERNTNVAYYDGHTAINDFCADQIRTFRPDRIYAEMCFRYPDARAQFPEEMNVTYTVTWFDWPTLDLYFQGFRQEISQMVRESQQITFRDCPSKELLVPYSKEFRLINHKASYLRQDPLGFHEKAFDLFVPYSLEEERITITSGDYLVFWLDANDHPEHYDGKVICFTDPLEMRRESDSDPWHAGRVVMTCCMADLQFMAFEMEDSGVLMGGWCTFEAEGQIASDRYGQWYLKLIPESVSYTSAPESGLILKTR